MLRYDTWISFLELLVPLLPFFSLLPPLRELTSQDFLGRSPKLDCCSRVETIAIIPPQLVADRREACLSPLSDDMR